MKTEILEVARYPVGQCSDTGQDHAGTKLTAFFHVHWFKQISAASLGTYFQEDVLES